jgi:mRNA interferase MazF
MEIKQYEILLVNLDPTVGGEIKKTRPCVVISPNEMNKYLKTIVIAPITSSSKQYPTRIELNQKKINGWIVLDQIRIIDKSRIIKKIADLSKLEIDRIKEVMHETFVE